MNLLDATHAILKQPISVVPSQLFSFYYSETQKATILLSIGQTAIPVLESVNEIKMRLSRLPASNIGGILQHTSGLQASAPVSGTEEVSSKE